MLFQPSMVADYVADLRKWLPERAYKSEITFVAQSKHAHAMADEIRAMRATESELRRARDFGDIPLIVLSEKWPLPERADPRDIETARIEDELQEEMSRFSRGGKHVRVDSGHLIPLEKPAAVIDAIRTVLGTPKK
jgi:hypothetical protein